MRKKEKVNRNKIEKERENRKRKIRDKKAEYGKKKRTPYL